MDLEVFIEGERRPGSAEDALSAGNTDLATIRPSRRSRPSLDASDGHVSIQEHEPLTPAQLTALTVLNAANASTPLCIPGTYERRDASGPSEETHTPPFAIISAIGPLEFSRLEYAREGGGAARERRGPRPDNLFVRLWRRVKDAPADRRSVQL